MTVCLTTLRGLPLVPQAGHVRAFQPIPSFRDLFFSARIIRAFSQPAAWRAALCVQEYFEKSAAASALAGIAIMNVANKARHRLGVAISRPAVERALRKPIVFMLAAGMAVGLAMTAWSSQAQAPSKDLWQSYMDAAEAADAAGDFKTEALTLARAFAFAKQHDAQGQRPVLSQLPLMLAYIELDEKDLWQSIAKEKLRIDVGNPGQGMTDYISTLDNYGWSYYTRWKAHLNNSSEKEAFKQTGRLYGAENSFRVEIALRQKLMSEDQDGLGAAEGSLGLVLSKRQKIRQFRRRI